MFLSKQKKLQQYIYKINSSLLAKKKWNLNLKVTDARKMDGVVVALADSQILSWINELNGTQDFDERAKKIKAEIKFIKKQPVSKENKLKISKLYEDLYSLQFKSDYLCVIMDKKSHYKRANKGFYVNGIKYKRLLCTTGGVKTQTVVYTSERLYDELYKRINNGRDETVPLVPAKYGAYQSLVASGSIEVSWPKDADSNIPGGVIVIKDCMTEFESDVIDVDDSNYPEEPRVELMLNQKIKNNCCDGCSIISPELSKRWNGELNGNSDRTISGFNLRNAYLKGMTFTFDFVKFAEDVVGASDEHQERYLITDYWGQQRDVRDALLIVTESQLKLCNCYSSWEDYYENCRKNKYTFRIAKTAPYFEELDEIRQLNYQFIAPLFLNNNDVQELIFPTVNEIKNIMGLDIRKVIAYLCGSNLDDETVEYADIIAKCLMVDGSMIQDSFIRNKIKKMISRRIRDAKIGVLDVNSNFQIIAGDVYAMAEFMFGMEPKGLLKAGQIYSKFWQNKGIKSVLCARAPMSNEHSLLTQNIAYDIKMDEWYQYMDSVAIVNAWDTMNMALNGFDEDGDLLYTTNNDVLMRRQTNLPALRCVQRKAEKKIITEDALIQANLDGFGSQIGQITNRCTSITSLMANYPKDSIEYKILKYRTQCFQNGQQNEIDKAKGIVTEPLPKSWWEQSENRIKPEDSEDIVEKKKLYAKLCASKKPYFFGYNYSSLKIEYDKYTKTAESNAISLYKKTMSEMVDMYNNNQLKNNDEVVFVENYLRRLPLDLSDSTVNKICWAIEHEFDGVDLFQDIKFDYKKLLSCNKYSEEAYVIIKKLCSNYKASMQIARKRANICDCSGEDEDWVSVDIILDKLIEDINKQCPNQEEACDILLNLCYEHGVSKSIVWKAYGDVIYHRLLAKNNYIIQYPQKDKNGDFWCQGVSYSMVSKRIKEGEENEICV